MAAPRARTGLRDRYSPRARSASMSPMSSRPTATRSRPSVMPEAARASALMKQLRYKAVEQEALSSP